MGDIEEFHHLIPQAGQRLKIKTAAKKVQFLLSSNNHKNIYNLNSYVSGIEFVHM